MNVGETFACTTCVCVGTVVMSSKTRGTTLVLLLDDVIELPLMDVEVIGRISHYSVLCGAMTGCKNFLLTAAVNYDTHA